MSAPAPTPAETAALEPERGRRVYVRYPCNKSTDAHVAMQESCIFHPVRVLDISAGGVALLLWDPMEKGDEVFVQLTNKRDESMMEIPAKVANVKQSGAKWITGINFDRHLDPEELARVI